MSYLLITRRHPWPRFGFSVWSNSALLWQQPPTFTLCPAGKVHGPNRRKRKGWRYPRRLTLTHKQWASVLINRESICKICCFALCLCAHSIVETAEQLVKILAAAPAHDWLQWLGIENENRIIFITSGRWPAASRPHILFFGAARHSRSPRNLWTRNTRCHFICLKTAWFHFHLSQGD